LCLDWILIVDRRQLEQVVLTLADFVTDCTGTVTGTADYDVWGNARASTGSQAEIGWTGELRDDATGLTYLRTRDYSPGGGRFLQRDTVSPNGPVSQGYKPYAYAAGNPATNTDATDHLTGFSSTTLELM
jgi:RHS repeat-associated protein